MIASAQSEVGSQRGTTQPEVPAWSKTKRMKDALLNTPFAKLRPSKTRNTASSTWTYERCEVTRAVARRSKGTGSDRPFRGQGREGAAARRARSVGCESWDVGLSGLRTAGPLGCWQGGGRIRRGRSRCSAWRGRR
ncbi:hypothetical protein KM043_005752 [Ampulex compressa]|nr:hypothetical protein KM043_005752 [Ampulex compressa]